MDDDAFQEKLLTIQVEDIFINRQDRLAALVSDPNCGIMRVGAVKLDCCCGEGLAGVDK